MRIVDSVLVLVATITSRNKQGWRLSARGEIVLKMRYRNLLDRQVYLRLRDEADGYLIDNDGIQSAFKTYSGFGRRAEMEIGPTFARVGTFVYRNNSSMQREVGLSAKFWGTRPDGRFGGEFPVVIRGIRLP